MYRYHISDTTKKVERCRADKQKCPLKTDTTHFDAQTPQEAEEKFQKYMGNKYGNFTTRRNRRATQQIPQTIKNDRNCQRKIRRLSSSGMEVQYVSTEDELFHQKKTAKNSDHLVDNPISHIDFVPEEVTIDKERIFKISNPLKAGV